MSAEAAVAAIRARGASSRGAARRRWELAVGADGDFDGWTEKFQSAGRLTLNFHPDRISRQGRSVASGQLAEGRYRSQWVTGISAGSRSAIPGGERQRFERQLFDGAYDGVSAESDELPVYGSLDLVFDDHGGSPRFGSSFLVLRRHVLGRTTLCVGDSPMAPRDVGTPHEPASILAGLAEQAARRELLNRPLGLDVLFGALDGSYRSCKPSRDLDGYIEAQVHGGVSLGSDVEAVVVDPSFRGTGVAQDLQAAADRHDFELGWHCGSELHVDDVPADFRGPAMPPLARECADQTGSWMHT